MATMTAVLTAGLIVAFAGAASALSPTFTATPTTGLTDGQTVHVTYSGFTPNQSAGVAVTSCRNANPGGINDCNTVANDHGTSDQALVFGATDGTGSGSVDVKVYTSIGTASNPFSCLTTPTCVLLLGDNVDQTVVRTTPIHFAGETVSPPAANNGSVTIGAGGSTTVTLGTTAGTYPVASCSLDAGNSAFSGTYGTGDRVLVTISNTPTPCQATITDSGSGSDTATFDFWATDSASPSNTSASSATETVNISGGSVTQDVHASVSAQGVLELSCNAPDDTANAFPLTTCSVADLTPVTLDGLSHNATGPAGSVYVVDTRGVAAPWTLSAQLAASPVVSGSACTGAVEFCNSSSGADASNANNHIAASAFSIGSIVCAPYTGNLNPSATATSGGTLDSVVDLCSATAGENTGTFKVDGQYSLHVPASAFAGLYQGTVLYLVA